MNSASYLTFSLHGLLLAVETKVVRQILWLPELTLMEECPAYIAGVVNMHGTLVPVMDLNSRFGHSPQGYGSADRVVLLDMSAWGMRSADFGIIVNDVLDVIDIPADAIELPPFETIETEAHPHFVGGLAKTEQGIVMILNLVKMLDAAFETPQAAIDPSRDAGSATPAKSYFCPEANEPEREIFHNRALALQQKSGDDDSLKAMSVAVVTLNSEYLCIELESVREFAKVHTITPVPCCPEHIVGNMNLRGNVLTLLDIRSLLNMQSSRSSESANVVVVDHGEFSVGVVVDEILDVIALREMDIVPVPASIKALDDTFVKGAVAYGSRMMALLDFKEILAWDGLLVNEEV